VKRIGGVAKAPGPDRIPGAALKMAIPHVGEDIRELMERHFPEIWKKATLVLVPKERKPAGLPSSYRPICLIDESAKIFERVIADRIGKQLRRNPTMGKNKLSECQFGFREGRSTVDAIKFVRE